MFFSGLYHDLQSFIGPINHTNKRVIFISLLFIGDYFFFYQNQCSLQTLVRLLNVYVFGFRHEEVDEQGHDQHPTLEEEENPRHEMAKHRVKTLSNDEDEHKADANHNARKISLGTNHAKGSQGNPKPAI